MPKLADSNCFFCSGTGSISAESAERANADLGFAYLQAGQRCPCTVSDAEIDAELPSLFDEILRRSETP